MTPQEAFSKLNDAAVLWAVGYGGAADVIRAACDALVAGIDGSELEILAGVPHRRAEEEVRDVLPAVVRELGLPDYLENGDDADVAALRVLASRTVAGELEPRELAAWTNRAYHLPVTQMLADFWGEYECLESTGRPGFTGYDTTDHLTLPSKPKLADSSSFPTRFRRGPTPPPIDRPPPAWSRLAPSPTHNPHLWTRSDPDRRQTTSTTRPMIRQAALLIARYRKLRNPPIPNRAVRGSSPLAGSSRSP
ncbi:hypothetical protein [Actinopolymorpha pittospori]|uniref:hypothetical protein n=1 Tax=Actinopolymorpha pittospori TaxID=648752 RepID=UPI00178AE3CD|nr:hypothetical protein [Actinopolymorpha pittospori]